MQPSYTSQLDVMRSMKTYHQKISTMNHVEYISDYKSNIVSKV